MADFAFNISKGRGVEFYNRVENNDPSTSALILVPLSASGTEAQGQDLDSLAAIEADANFAEITTGGWSRKTLTDTELAAFPAPDDTNNRYAVAVPQVTWTSVAAGNNATGLLVCYDANTGAGSDSDIIPITHHTFSVTTDGNNVVLQVGDFLRAS
jgi:hypothetical protein